MEEQGQSGGLAGGTLKEGQGRDGGQGARRVLERAALTQKLMWASKGGLKWAPP